jgi:type II secretory ATPase GspE/PulE/Tfp pilus assembly ATPase PilB-like protein
MTGHLVLSTLHTNDAASALPRLVNMDVPTFLIASTVNLIIAQRLVRKLCQHCITSFNIDAKGLKELGGSLDLSALHDGLVKVGAISDRFSSIKDVLFYRGKGCNQCGQEGYRGRIGIYEVLEMTPAIQELLLKKASAEQILQAARQAGMITMLEDGFLKAQAGVTSIEEVLRVATE